MFLAQQETLITACWARCSGEDGARAICSSVILPCAHAVLERAARESNVTPPAVSRAVGGLERHLGCRLLKRLHGTLELTEEGRALYAAVQGGFARIETAIDEMTKDLAEAKSVTLSITSAFALHWLMPRFHDLQEALPDISLRFELIDGAPCGPLEQADLGLRHAARPRAGLAITPLVPETVIPV
jgi:DNA-binding transcriptional LysR family regulator